MRLTIKYFASIREQLGMQQEVVDVDAPQLTIDALRARLASRNAQMAAALPEGRRVRTAVNHEMVAGSFVVREDSEIAFFPPVTGG
ncbi:molybdopterin converting factor subunit 1 [Paraburkholderia sp. CNPSo 3274]|uniref:molybdopterin converting factor subunit 1 n=1 Tax=Paraburkholderia sp. CNPSo 3274 TaxID=2940932 RepID=UPI0020B8B5F6|nr:molybdopterin converting factor subunit 1 [Paraburkholderia sp. CNPSo 3274]MCP3707146.1 molybdopterin converting factor subunit 1 [Paraburkholderia sp. CNPSo 3274]